MLRSILVGIDGSEHSELALEVGILWAKRFDALLVGIGIVDEPGIHDPAEYVVGETLFRDVNKTPLAEQRRGVARSLARYVRRCTEAGVAYRVLEGIATPYVQILMEAQRYDLIVLGHHTHFQFESEAEPDVTLSKVLAASPRPVVAMPDKLRDGEAVLIAYDGSLQAARALAAFESSGLGQGRPVHVVGADSKKEAERCSKRAVEFLRLHQVEAEACPVESVQSPVEVILDSIEMLDAGLLVMGAYG